MKVCYLPITYNVQFNQNLKFNLIHFYDQVLLFLLSCTLSLAAVVPNTADSVNTAEDRFFKFPKLFNIPDKSSEEVEYKRPHYYPVYTTTPRPLFLNVNLPKLPSFKKPKLPLPAKKVPLIVVPIIKPGKPLKQKKPNIQLITRDRYRWS